MNKKQLLLTTMLCALGCIAWYTRTWREPYGRQNPRRDATHTMTIFVHGTFNPGLGLLNVVDLFSGNVSGGEYARIVGSMRDDEFFYQEQPMLARGLVAFEPTFEQQDGKYKLAAYPIANAYEEVAQQLHPGKVINHYYTFGWSGLLSAEERTKASQEFAKELVREYATLQKSGISVKIRIVAHSHGGNVALGLCTQQEVPRIDELVMLGTPVQEETSTFVNSPLFGKIYNLYSSADTAQSADFISTKQRESKRTFAQTPQNMVQAQLLVNYDKANTQKQTSLSLWEKVFGGGALETQDPSHKDLWFLTWNKEFCQPNFPFKPLPMVLFVPLILDVLRQPGNVQVNVSTTGGQICAQVLGDTTQVAMPMTNFITIKKQVMGWEPRRISKQESFENLLARRE